MKPSAVNLQSLKVFTFYSLTQQCFPYTLQVEGLLLVVIQSSQLYTQRKHFEQLVGPVVQLVHENTSCHQAIAESLQELKVSLDAFWSKRYLNDHINQYWSIPEYVLINTHSVTRRREKIAMSMLIFQLFVPTEEWKKNSVTTLFVQ